MSPHAQFYHAPVASQRQNVFANAANVEHEYQHDSDEEMVDVPASPIFSVHTPASSCTSDGDDDDMAVVPAAPMPNPANLGSPAPSVYSLTESLVRASFRHEFGRDVQAHSDIYHLPADTPEFDRLNRQHMLLTWVLGKYPPPLPGVLRHDPERPQKAVLDLGCGTGAWLADVATDFPHIDALGVDLVPAQLTRVPANVRTEVDDINLGLEHFYGQFDLVNARLISAGIRDYAGLVDHISRIARPEGLVILSECDFRVYNEDLEPYSLPHISPNWVAVSAPMNIPAIAQYMALLRRCIRDRGGHVDAANLLHRWVSQHRAFKDVAYRDVFLPVAPFMRGDTPEANRQRKVGLLTRDDLLEFVDSGRPMLLKAGIPEQEVDTLLVRTRAELRDARARCYMRLQSVFATKRS